MAIYTGFFDAAFDEDTGTYDREYGSADFTEYFGQVVGSGVCVYGNDDSMKVYYDSASQRAVVNPGYLFIRGYWLRNDGLYAVSLADLPAGVYAIRAVLNMGSRAVTIGQVAKADPEEYPDALVLAYATVEAGGGVFVEDTRSRTDICGLIDAAGSLSQKVEYAIHYIDNEIQTKLDQIQLDLQAQEAEIDGKIEEANSLIAQIAPPAIGTIKFSASRDIEEGWLRCDGSFINEADYPELVAALGKNYPSGDKFQLLNTTGVGRQISNGVVCLGRLWVFSYADRKLYGIDVEGDEAPKVIEITSGDPDYVNFIPPDNAFIALSIIPNLTSGSNYHLFIAQMLQSGRKLLIFTSQFSGVENSISVSMAADYSDLSISTYDKTPGVMLVASKMVNSLETFYTCPQTADKDPNGSNAQLYTDILFWRSGSLPEIEEVSSGYMKSSYRLVHSFNQSNQGECVISVIGNVNGYDNKIVSFPEGIFDKTYIHSTQSIKVSSTYAERTTTVIVGDEAILIQVSPDLTELIMADRINGGEFKKIQIGVGLPPSAHPFVDGSVYLWGKKMFMIFVGTGIIFSRDLSEGSFGYLDTTSVLGTITQYASIRYSQDEGTLYIAGQDTTNTVRAAKIVLNTLYDYANDGAWLPMIASDGIPAYIKAKEVGGV